MSDIYKVCGRLFGYAFNDFMKNDLDVDELTIFYEKEYGEEIWSGDLKTEDCSATVQTTL